MKKILLAFLVLACVLCLFACTSEPPPPAEDHALTEYTVPDGAFTLTDFEARKEDGAYYVTLTSLSTQPLLSYEVSVRLCAHDGAVLDTQTLTGGAVTANTPFLTELSIGRDVYEALRACEADYTGKSAQAPVIAEKTANRLEKYTVRFFAGSEELSAVSVRAGERAPLPQSPTRKKYFFAGWYTERALTHEYDPSAPVTEDLSLYAKFVLNAEPIINAIHRESMAGILTVWNESYSLTSRSLMQGSGVIVRIADGMAYALTNCHVARKLAAYPAQRLSVTDTFGESYVAKIYRDPTTGKEAISPEYDLALLCFSVPDETRLRAISFGEMPVSGDDVISLGTPKGQVNSVTLGKMLYHAAAGSLEVEEYLSAVRFSVLYHDAYITNGSSGGALLNIDRKLIGIQYATIASAGVYCAIPINRVRGFLDQFAPCLSFLPSGDTMQGG